MVADAELVTVPGIIRAVDARLVVPKATGARLVVPRAVDARLEVP